ncbi:MAG: tripartite tricarboxylate transporter TctB family protein [Rubrivivax sp.]
MSADKVGARGPELAVAALLLLLSGLVVADSLRVGTGWADDGPRSGYFPFYIGCLLLLSSGWIFVRQLLRWRQDSTPFAERAQIVQVLAVLLPMAVYVGLIFPLGIYVASALLIVFFMRRFGRYRWPVTLPVALGVPLFFFLIFERWFLVPLPKGPLEQLLLGL